MSLIFIHVIQRYYILNIVGKVWQNGTIKFILVTSKSGCGFSIQIMPNPVKSTTTSKVDRYFINLDYPTVSSTEHVFPLYMRV